MMPDGALAMPAAALAAVLLDRLLGEVRRFHPLVGFGNLAAAVEKHLNKRHLPAGLLAWALVVLPFVALAFALRPLAPFAVDVALLYFALGAQSLCEHAEAIAKPLQDGHLDEARQRVGWIVSRDTSALDESGVAKAGMESVLENGNDAIFGTLFWFALLGGPGAPAERSRPWNWMCRNRGRRRGRRRSEAWRKQVRCAAGRRCYASQRRLSRQLVIRIPRRTEAATQGRVPSVRWSQLTGQVP